MPRKQSSFQFPLWISSRKVEGNFAYVADSRCFNFLSGSVVGKDSMRLSPALTSISFNFLSGSVVGKFMKRVAYHLGDVRVSISSLDQ